MMEGKSKDVSIIKLRPGLLLLYSPDVAARFGIYSDDADELLADERVLKQGVSAETEPDVDEGQVSMPPEVEPVRAPGAARQ